MSNPDWKDATINLTFSPNMIFPPGTVGHLKKCEVIAKRSREICRLQNRKLKVSLILTCRRQRAAYFIVTVRTQKCCDLAVIVTGFGEELGMSDLPKYVLRILIGRGNIRYYLGGMGGKLGCASHLAAENFSKN